MQSTITKTQTKNNSKRWKAVSCWANYFIFLHNNDEHERFYISHRSRIATHSVSLMIYCFTYKMIIINSSSTVFAAARILRTKYKSWSDITSELFQIASNVKKNDGKNKFFLNFSVTHIIIDCYTVIWRHSCSSRLV